MLDWDNTGTSVMETSHRSKEYEAVHNEAIALVKELIGLPENYQVLFLQGGASLQFAMVPMNLLSPARRPTTINTGTWAKKAIAEAKLFGNVNIAWGGEKGNATEIPKSGPSSTSPPAPATCTSRATTRSRGRSTTPSPTPKGVPIICDMSSDFLWAPFDPKPFGLIYAGAQKNVGPAGVTVVDHPLRPARTVQGRDPDHPEVQDAREGELPLQHAALLRDLHDPKRPRHREGDGRAQGDGGHNRKKGGMIYEIIDGHSDFFRSPVARDARSYMNIVFRLPSEELEEKFVAEGKKRRFLGLKGHRSVGGIRISTYNSCPMEACEAVTSFMKEFVKANG